MYGMNYDTWKTTEPIHEEPTQAWQCDRCGIRIEGPEDSLQDLAYDHLGNCHASQDGMSPAERTLWEDIGKLREAVGKLDSAVEELGGLLP